MMRFFLPIFFTFPLAANAETFTADVWADNWFAMYVDGELVLEDSVSITTERSFNSETGRFDADRPAQIAIVAKDFMENDTGLEYIGSRRQQMGDGGIIAQIKDASGSVLAVTDDGARCMVIHHAPIKTSCADENNPVRGQGACASRISAEPEGWMLEGFDDSGWDPATEYSERAVRPKGGYDRINWDRNAALIWGPDLERDNTILCRITLR